MITQKPGYYNVSLEGKKYLVHRLVAETFVNNPNNYDCVNHLDGNKKNNTPKNLEWCNRSQNMKHGYSSGLILTHKASNVNKIITEEKKLIINKMKNLGFTLKEIACLCGVNISTISKTLNK